jgi:hypothetical protein
VTCTSDVTLHRASMITAAEPLANATSGTAGRTPVVASAEEIRYAQQLRERIRQAYARRSTPQPAPWCVGAD